MPLAGNPTWEDHFLGLVLDPRYRSALGATDPSNPSHNPVVALCKGNAQSNPNSVGGRVTLQTNTYMQANCYLRFGEASGDTEQAAPVDVRNWSIRRGATGESRVVYGTNTYLQTSVGFVGWNDPNNFCEFYYDSRAATSTWRIGCCLNGKSQFVDTGFTHSPGEWVLFQVQTSFVNGAPRVDAYINDVCVASITDPSVIPLDPLSWEWNIYNFPKGDGTFSNSAMWLDWLYLTQNR